ncbi:MULTISPECIES: mevalonate kinase [Oceanobacillus]|uniref:mevalonate kinase n=1 Tax=Oceanobacillus indicireducens TaxID=1004261 RepID=A0A918D520_9BACI|nr:MULTISPECIES: mevalonate kinase [Oceanobacillus]GGN65622.1 mevalonate kinase [Oceanobacillus indicireducens]
MSAEKVSTSAKTAIGIAHSKFILIGEHAVVHGQPAIAIPFPLIGVETMIEYVPGPAILDSSFYYGPIHMTPKSLRGIADCITDTLEYLEIPCENLVIRINSSVPPGKGLGSSASVAVSVIRSLFNYAERECTHEELLKLADIAETYAHGSPSGIDTLTITANTPIWFEKNHPIERIAVKEDLYFLVADSGQDADTKSSVQSVTDLLKKAPRTIQRKLDRIGQLTHEAKDALEKASKHFLGSMLNEAQKELEYLGVSDAVLNRLIRFARQEGALGAKLTGGGNGGCIIALAQNEVHCKQLADKLKQFGAHSVWPFVLKKNG